MRAIFWDLETTDLNFCAQILNYAFVLVDNNFEEIERITGKIRLSRIQLPSPMAVYVNRTDILEHQKDPELETEPVAMKRIQEWVSDIAERSQSIVPLIGYNSTKFDLNFLRTSMIRSGVSPYWGAGIISYRDVLHSVQKLATSNKKFLKLITETEGKPNLKLANVSTKLKLLNEGEEQSHESLEDVILTIKLAQVLYDVYDIDPREYRSYEAKDDSRTIFIRSFPAFTEESDGCFEYEDKISPLAFLDSNKSYSLFVDLDRYKAGQGKASICWFNKNTSPFYVNDTSTEKSLLDLANKARKEFSGTSVNNFFGEISCDIEQHIYAMPIKGINCLQHAIWERNVVPLKELDSEYAWEIFYRYCIANAKLLREKDSLKWFDAYCKYRYTGEMVVSKNGKVNHKTIGQLFKEIENLDEWDEKDTKIKQSLMEYYKNSEVLSSLKKQSIDIYV